MSKIKIDTRFDLSAKIKPDSFDAEKNTVDFVIYSEGEKARRFSIGGGEYYISFDIDGMNLERLNSGRMPHLLAHDSYSGAILGRVLSARKEDGKVIGTSLLKESDAVPAVNQALNDIRNGFMPNISAGIDAYQYEKQEEKFNGKPHFIIKKSEPFEVSSIPIGAISSATLLSEINSNGEEINLEKETKMEEEIKKEVETVDVEKLRKEAIEAERERINAISLSAEKLGLQDDPAVKEMLSSGLSVEAAREKLIDMKAELSAKSEISSVHLIADEGDKVKLQAEDFMVAKLSGNTIGKLDSGNRFRNVSILEMGKMLRVPCVKEGNSKYENARQMLMSTSDFPNILSSAMNKKLVKEYGEVSKMYEQIAMRSDFNDFKSVSYNQLNGFDEFGLVKEGAEYGYVSMTDAKVEASACKYGVILPFTMECLINDDLNAFERKYREAFKVANRKEREIIFKENLADNPVMSDGKVLFHSDHNNTASTSPAAPTAAQLKKMMKLFAAQTGPNGETLGLRMKYVIMPTALQADYEELMTPNYQPTTSSAAVTGTMRSMIPIYDPFVDEATSTKWYGMADREQIESFVYGYLAGTNGPVIEQEGGFTSDTLNFKFRLVFGARCLDWRGLTYNPGT